MAASVIGKIPSGRPTKRKASSAAVATVSARASATPMSSAAKITRRRSTKSGSSPASIMRAIQ
jgi:hypothetical protein